jgi:beta-lactamase regulating signal transducer with metallopeptidase domain
MILPVEGSVFTITMASWLSLILELVFKGGVLVSFGWVATHLMRRGPASIRSQVWTGVFVAALILPLAFPIAGRISIFLGESSVYLQLEQMQPTFSQHLAVPGGGPLTSEESLPRVERSQDRSLAKPVAQNWLKISVWIWLVGVFAFSGRLLRRVLAGRLAARRAEPSSSRYLAFLLRKTQQQLGSDTPVEIRISPTEPAPFVIGVTRPVLVLPKSVHRWSRSAAVAMLQHELAHVARRDYLKIVLVQLACVLHWFNPLMWKCARRARLDLEVACDDRVLACGTNPFDYAQQLLQLAAQFRRSAPANATAVTMADITDLEERMTMILKNKKQTAPSRRTVIAVGALVSLIVLPVAATQFVAKAPALRDVEVSSDQAPPAPPAPPAQPLEPDTVTPATPAPPAPRPDLAPRPRVAPRPDAAPAPAMSPAPPADIAAPAPAAQTVSPSSPRQIDEIDKELSRVMLIEDQELEAMLVEFYASLKRSEHKNKRVMKADVPNELLKQIADRVVEQIPEGATGRMKLKTSTDDGTPLNVIIVKESVDAENVSRIALKISTDHGEEPGMTLLMMLGDGEEGLKMK